MKEADLVIVAERRAGRPKKEAEATGRLLIEAKPTKKASKKGTS